MNAWALTMAAPMIPTRLRPNAVWLRASRLAAYTVHWAKTSTNPNPSNIVFAGTNGTLMPFGTQGAPLSVDSVRNSIHSASMAPINDPAATQPRAVPTNICRFGAGGAAEGRASISRVSVASDRVGARARQPRAGR